MASRVQKIMFWDTFKNAKSVILHYFPVAEIGSNIHLLYFSYPQEILAQFVEWGKKVLSPYRPHWSVYFSVSLLQIAGKHPVLIKCTLDETFLDKHQFALLCMQGAVRWCSRSALVMGMLVSCYQYKVTGQSLWFWHLYLANFQLITFISSNCIKLIFRP